ncbi:hypothetical protein Micbo1qcDRAFT_65263 [Microdochium bolleyi]|uniref:DUF423-domain-containing protein n=1 Tax=Microdochium bolleyi TaxID=196109 RepID=A0A136J2M0_9PEZI|nr:hypothetical protein Micbo1qcDRAFT_65263 [Microdochium bolleyi]
MPSEQSPLLASTSPAAAAPSRDATSPRRSRNMFWTLGCIYGAAAVGFGAFGAHGLKKVVSDPARLANFGTAAHYQLVHSVALLVASQAAPQNTLAGGLFTAGMTMFSGSIYALVLDPARFRFLGPVTPLGGLCLIGGWVALGLS